MARPLPKTNAPALVKNQRIWARRSGVTATARHAGAARREPGRRRLRDDRDHAAQQEQPEDLRLGPRGDDGHHREDGPLQPVLRQRQLGQLVGGQRDDADDGGADAVERRLHPGQPAEAHVEPADGQHHDERRQDERERDQGRAAHARVDVAQADRELRGQGPGRELRERQRLHVLVLGEPPAALHQVALHVADEGDRAAEAEAARGRGST